MTGQVQRVLFVTVIAAGALLVLYPWVPAANPVLATVWMRRAPITRPPMPTYEPPPGTVERMPVARPGVELRDRHVAPQPPPQRGRVLVY